MPADTSMPAETEGNALTVELTLEADTTTAPLNWYVVANKGNVHVESTLFHVEIAKAAQYAITQAEIIRNALVLTYANENCEVPSRIEVQLFNPDNGNWYIFMDNYTRGLTPAEATLDAENKATFTDTEGVLSSLPAGDYYALIRFYYSNNVTDFTLYSVKKQ